MNKKTRAKIERVERALYISGRAIRPVPDSHYFAPRLMAAIGELDFYPTGAVSTAFLDRVVWRFAYAAMAVALILSAYTYNQGFSPDREIVAIQMSVRLENLMSQNVGL